MSGLARNKKNIPSRGLTYPTWGSSENHRLKMPFLGDMLISWRVFHIHDSFFKKKNLAVMGENLQNHNVKRISLMNFLIFLSISLQKRCVDLIFSFKKNIWF